METLRALELHVPRMSITTKIIALSRLTTMHIWIRVDMLIR